MFSRTLSLILFVTILACDDKNQCVNSDNCVRVKLHKEFCGQAILEILDPAYFDKGQDWTDAGGVEYRNVFSTILPCSIPNYLTSASGVLLPEIEFYIHFTNTQDDDNCARCLALLDGPQKFSHIEIGSNCTGPELE